MMSATHSVRKSSATDNCGVRVLVIQISVSTAEANVRAVNREKAKAKFPREVSSRLRASTTTLGKPPTPGRLPATSHDTGWC
jgi:hypothetical protein